MERSVDPARSLQGTVRVPGDKSITHRAYLLAALSLGRSTVAGANPGADCRALRTALSQLGARVSIASRGEEGEHIVVEGAAGPLHGEALALDLGNSGTALRLLTGALSWMRGSATLDGDLSLRSRPIRRVTEPLSRMGAKIQHPVHPDRCPIVVRGAELHGIRYASPIASAQVKSCLLLAALGAEGETRIEEPLLSRDHTERMLPLFGVSVRRDAAGAPSVAISGGEQPLAADVQVPGDFSAAAFWLVAASLVPGSRITLSDVGLNPTRTGLLAVLLAMGARITVERERERCGEPVGDLKVEGAALRGTRVTPEAIPGMIDEVPVWAVAAAGAEGVSEITGAAELRAKESDRLDAVGDLLTTLGCEFEPRPDGFRIVGRGGRPGGRPPFPESSFDSRSDHRMAMAAHVAALAAEGPIRVKGCEMVDTSYPGFYASLTKLVSAQ